MALVLITVFTSAGLAAEETRKADVRGYRASVATPILEQVGGKLTGKQALEQLGQIPSSLRFDGSTKGDTIRVYCFFYRGTDDKNNAQVRVREKARQPLVVEQFRTLLQVFSAVAASEAEAVDPIKVQSFPYTLTLPRANVTITAEVNQKPFSTKPENDSKAQWVVVFDFTDQGQEDANAPRTAETIKTGPQEQWSISADVPLSTVGDVKVDKKGENIELAKTPDAFYAGLNFTPFGDVLRDPASFREAVTFKALLKASRRPSDSFGIGIGIRPGLFANAPAIFQILDTLSPYVAYVRTRVEENQTDAAGKTTKVRFKRNDLTIGISLDINKALDFVKGKGDGSAGEKK
jgi:hypothetical protein